MPFLRIGQCDDDKLDGLSSAGAAGLEYSRATVVGLCYPSLLSILIVKRRRSMSTKRGSGCQGNVDVIFVAPAFG